MVDKKQAVEPTSAVEQQEKASVSKTVVRRRVRKAKKPKKESNGKKISELTPEERERVRELNRESVRKHRAMVKADHSDLRVLIKRSTKDKLAYLSKTYDMTLQDIISKLIEAEHDRLMND